MAAAIGVGMLLVWLPLVYRVPERTLLYTVRIGVALVLLTPLIVTSGSFFPFIVGKALYSRTVIEGTFALWLVLAYSYPAYRPPRSWVLLAFTIFLAVSILASVLGVSLQRSLWSTFERMQGVFDLAHWFALTLVITSVYRSWWDWRLLLNLSLGASLIMALLGVAQRYGTDIVPGDSYGFLFREGGSRLDITLGNSTFVGAYMLVNVLIGLAFLVHSYRGSQLARAVQTSLPFLPSGGEAEPRPTPGRRRRRRRRSGEGRGGPIDHSLIWWQLFWIATIGLDFWILVLSGTRGATIGLVAGLLVFAVGYLVWGQSRAVRVAAISLIGVLIAVAVLVVGARYWEGLADSNVLLRRFTAIGLDDASVKGRIASLSTGLQGFVAKPILGWGPENYFVVFGRYFEEDPDVPETFDQAHNKLVEEMTTKGLLGLFSYVSIWVLMFWIVARRARRRDAQQLFLLFMGAALTGYFVQNLFLFDTPGTVLQFILLVAFAASLETTLEAGAVEDTPERRRSDEQAAADDDGTPGWGRRLLGGVWASWSQSPVSERVGAIGRAKVFTPGVVPSYVLVPLAVAVMSLAAGSAWYFNYRPYEAARAVVKTAEPGISWHERYDLFDESIGRFPQLANYPRLILFNQLINNWDSLPESVARRGLEIVQREGEETTRTEPEMWLGYVALAFFYQKAASLDPIYDETARSYFEIAKKLAGDTAEVNRLRRLFAN